MPLGIIDGAQAEKNMECVTVLHSGCRVEYSDGV